MGPQALPMSRPFCFLLVVLLFSMPLEAQRTLTGLVLEEDSKGKISPLVGAGVWWKDTQTGTSTDEYGVFRLPDLRHQHPLIVSFTGYMPDTLYIRDHDSVTVILRQRRTLKTAEITGRQASTYISSLDPLKTEVITRAELYKAACCNLSESFETNATVDVNATDAITGARQIRMLGLSGGMPNSLRKICPGSGHWPSLLDSHSRLAAGLNQYKLTKGLVQLPTDLNRSADRSIRS
jgi:outer membrane receptor for ferrienterochelin and colicins